ncbi:hypothetical protein [Streptomyces gulbargensis]
MARRRETYTDHYEGDFGLSALTAAVCAAAPVDVPAALRLAAGAANLCAGEGAVELGADVRILLDSAVPEEALRAVWLAATGGRFDPAGHGMTTRAWLGRLAELYPARERTPAPRHAYGYAPTRPDVDEARLREDVVAEIRASAAEAPALTAPPLSGVPAALEAIAEEADADLALRLYLRVLKAWHIPVDKAQFDRLMVLDERLAYPGPLVYDGLDVRWPPLDPARRDAEGDFGLSALAARFASPWHTRTAEGVVREAAAADETAQTPGSAAVLLLQDAVRLLDSPLPTGTIARVWAAASERGYDAEREGTDARDWLRTIAEVCRTRLAEVAPAYVPGHSPARTELAGAVLEVLRAVAPELADRTVSPHASPLTGTDAAEAVAAVVTEADPDLGFRLLLRLLDVLAVPLTEERYARCRALGERFGHGPWLVSEAVERLVRNE